TLGQRSDGRASKEREAPQADAAGREWLREGAAVLVPEPDAKYPAKHCWAWGPFDQSVGFWSRRTAHEAAMHRWDAQNAGAGADGFDAGLAADGVDEYLGILGAFRGRRFPEAASIHLHATDTPGEWLVRPDAAAGQLTRW